jgi:hypothetical protein
MSYTVVHHELVEGGAERGQQESEVYRFLEGSESELEKWRNNRAPRGFLTRAEVFEIALEGDAIIRGWGAASLLKSVPNVLSVRVSAPMDFRIAQMMQRLGVDARAARREIERSDAAHGRAFLRFFEQDWRDPANYDIVLNTEHLSPHICADILCDAVRNPAFAETPDTKRVLLDRLLEARISTAFSDDAGLHRRGTHVNVSVDAAEVRLYGIVADAASRGIAERIASSQDGVSAVRNEIVRINGFE